MGRVAVKSGPVRSKKKAGKQATKKRGRGRPVSTTSRVTARLPDDLTQFTQRRVNATGMKRTDLLVVALRYYKKMIEPDAADSGSLTAPLPSGKVITDRVGQLRIVMYEIGVELRQLQQVAKGASGARVSEANPSAIVPPRLGQLVKIVGEIGVELKSIQNLAKDS